MKKHLTGFANHGCGPIWSIPPDSTRLYYTPDRDGSIVIRFESKSIHDHWFASLDDIVFYFDDGSKIHFKNDCDGVKEFLDDYSEKLYYEEQEPLEPIADEMLTI